MLNMSTSLAVKSGKTGIRTLGTVARSPHFECGPFDHSGIFPCAKVQLFSQHSIADARFFYILNNENSTHSNEPRLVRRCSQLASR